MNYKIRKISHIGLSTFVVLMTLYLSAAGQGNNPPQFVASATTVSPASLDRVGPAVTTISSTFTDADIPGNSVFFVSFSVLAPYLQGEVVIADRLQHGSGGLTIVYNGNGSYTASMLYDPASNSVLGAYDLRCIVSDGVDTTEDGFAANPNELTITNGGENVPPVVISDATFPSPAAIERIGANTTVISATFNDGDAPALSTFAVTFKLRKPDNVTEIILADNVSSGTGGVSIVDLGGGTYTASINWDPPDLQDTSVYDLYFHVTDGIDTSYDRFANNLDELQVYDAVTNKTPSLVAGNTFALPTTVNRIGAGFTMLKVAFSDADYPGSGAFRVTFKVRDPSLGEIIVANNAAHTEQGVRITHTSGTGYEAAVLWDPNVAALTGSYDLFFSVTDNNGATATDGYLNNSAELTVNSLPITGDGHLLRRSSLSTGCGGTASACHNLPDHQLMSCLDCHTPHGTANIYLVRDTIQTPNSGAREVIFKTLGIGDPYNGPDPITGDPTSGVMGDSTDNAFTGVCEVCHTTTAHHRNDGSQPGPNHNDAQNCISCHTHESGFSPGESAGGASCSCHNSIFSTMDSVATGSRHILANNDANYSPGASGMFSIKNCLTCHVDHDIFRPDLNPGVGQRGKNLRVDYATDPVQGNNAMLSNSDYSSAGLGGLCLSCHSDNVTCSGCHGANIAPSALAAPTTFDHTIISRIDFDSATTSHNYSVPATFSTDGSVFNGNCVKCHSDDLTKSYQSSTNMFSTHGSTFSKILDSAGIAGAINPLEESFCYKCHSNTSNPNAGANLDFFGVKAMSAPALQIESELGMTFSHPVGTFSGLHIMDEDPSLMPRHVECTDCHNPHAARAGGTTISNALKGVRGVDTSGTSISEASYSYEVCFKCHGDQNSGVAIVPRDDGSTNTRLEFHPSSLSYHPVTAAGKNPNSPSLILPWTETSIMSCEDCHATPGGGTAGPHGSSFRPLLKLKQVTADNTSESAADYALCYSCHDRNSILGDASFGKHNKHIVGVKTPCSVCHDPHGVYTVGAGSGSHLINFDTTVCTPSSSGRLEFIDNGTFKGRCYVLCHGKNHNPKSY